MTGYSQFAKKKALIIPAQIITPTYTAGTKYGKINNELLRPPSIRSLLRWFYRATLGGVMFSQGKLDIKEIKKREESIWGSAEIKGKVAIKVKNGNAMTYLVDNIKSRRKRLGISYSKYT